LDKKKQSVSLLLSRFRGWIQAAATLLTNIHLPNFFKGGIYQGKGKSVCVPGLNCYSCPAASGACPIGAFQAVVGSSKFRFSYYITGILILLGVLLGRFICGFLCPFGWLQELLHKIPGKKLSTKKLKPLTYLKYVILLLINIILLVLGCFMDLTPLVLIMTPILLPVVKSFGMDPVQFGVVMMLNLGIGLCTPPVGTALFTGCAIAGRKIESVSKATLPLYVPMLVVLLLVTYIPELTMALPNLLMK